MALKELPDWWVELNAEYCWPLYDCGKLARPRNRKGISVDGLKACELTNECPEEQ